MAKKIEGPEQVAQQDRDEVEIPAISVEDLPREEAGAAAVADSRPKPTPPPVVKEFSQGRAGVAMGLSRSRKITHATGRALAAQKKVRVFLPKLEGLDDKFQVETVQINGWTVAVNRGVYVDVPKSVAEVLRSAGHPVDM